MAAGQSNFISLTPRAVKEMAHGEVDVEMALGAP